MASIQFSHANGFPAPVYEPFLRHFPQHDIHAIPVLGEGTYAIRNSWKSLARELIDTIESRQNGPVVGIGHSLGGVATFWAAQERPDLFSQVFLLDPPIFQWSVRFLSGLTRLIGVQSRLVPIIRKAHQRRDQFMSREEATSYWKPKRLFRDFDPEAFAAYVEHGLVDHPDGDLTLRISKKAEAKVFSTSPVFLGDCRLQMPSYYLHPTKGVLTSRALKEHKKNFTNTQFVSVEGGHMFPLENPKETAELIQGLMQEGK